MVIYPCRFQCYVLSGCRQVVCLVGKVLLAVCRDEWMRCCYMTGPATYPQNHGTEGALLIKTYQNASSISSTYTPPLPANPVTRIITEGDI